MKALAAEILSLRPTKRQPPQPQAGPFLDHFSFWTRGGDLVVWDDPYLPSSTLEAEGVLRGEGWRICHLPSSMSLYIAGKCQPRLLVPPGSKVDLGQMAALLQLAEFRGCFALTEKFCATDADVCAVRRRLAAEGNYYK